MHYSPRDVTIILKNRSNLQLVLNIIGKKLGGISNTLNLMVQKPNLHFSTSSFSFLYQQFLFGFFPIGS